MRSSPRAVTAARGTEVGARLFCVHIDELRESDVSRLSDARLAKADRFLRERDRRLSLAAGVALDRGLCDYGLCEKDVELAVAPGGKPYFPEHPEVNFSLSHAGRLAVAAFSDVEVGVDVEPPHKVNWRLVERRFHAEEIVDLRASADPDRDFTRLWTCKESYLKAMGTGLSAGLSTFCVLLGENGAQLSDSLWALEERREYDHFIAITTKARVPQKP